MEKCTFDLTPDQTHLSVHLNMPRFEAATVGDFKKGFENAWKPSIQSVTVYCETVDFIDSSGIGALLSIQKKIKKEGAITLKSAKPSVISVVELLRLHRVFNLSNN